MIKVGISTLNQQKITIGTTELQRVYVGSNLVWQKNYGILPTVTTSSVSTITATTAAGGGNVTSDGGATVTVRGVCWSIASNPTTSNIKTIDGSGTGSFTSSITSLVAGTTYYVRAYATNSVGTSYGSNISFVAEICTRPGGLPTFIFYSEVGHSLLTIDNVFYYAANPSNFSNFYFGSTTETDGDPVYDSSTGTDCTKLIDGYYVMTDDNETFHSAVQITGGILHYLYQ